MGIRQRIDDSKFLLAHGRLSGAVLSVCAAISGTSRRRYPSPALRDHEAFTRFLGEEVRVVSYGADVNMYIACASSKRRYPGGMMPLQDMLYEFVRCELAHEGGLSGIVDFLPCDEWMLQFTENGLVLGGGVLRGMMRVAEFAPENAVEFPEIARLSSDEVAERLFGERKHLHADYLKLREERARNAASHTSD